MTGTASATVPMTLMKIFGRQPITLTVTCDAEERLPNTDIMFVLDTTGSMAQPAVSTDTVSKISGLKTAVKCFYEILAKLDTSATCAGGAPSGGTGTDTQIRFGFMPYSTNVNVGKLLPTAYFADTWPYQSRELIGGAGTWTHLEYRKPDKKGKCISPYPNTSTTSYRSTVVTISGVKQCDVESSSLKGNWHYRQIDEPVGDLKNGQLWDSTMNVAINDDGTARTVVWDGCIEERATVKQTTFPTIPSAAYDLDIDRVPDPTDPKTLWGPALQQLIYARSVQANGSGSLNYSDVTTTDNYYNNIPMS